MSFFHRAAASLCLTLACTVGAWAQGPVPPVLASAQTPESAASAVAASTKAQPHVVVIEDDGVRIEEVRDARRGGAAQRITVQSKLGQVRAYEIMVAPAGRDPSQGRGNAGRHAWSIFSF